MDPPEYCFCGCDERVGKANVANLEGYPVVLELGRWLNYLSIMNAAGPEHDWSQVEAFMEDGAMVYRALLAEVHEGRRTKRKERKLARRWVKFSRKTREQMAAEVIGPREPNPFEAEMPHPLQIREWVYDGTLLPLDSPSQRSSAGSDEWTQSEDPALLESGTGFWNRMYARFPELSKMSRHDSEDLADEVGNMRFDGASERKVRKHVQARIRELEQAGRLYSEGGLPLTDEELREYRKKWWPERHGDE